jgi:small conductance mechanosensitive channel
MSLFYRFLSSLRPVAGFTSARLSVLALAILIAVAPAGAQSPWQDIAPSTSASASTESSNAALKDLIVTLESETGRGELIDQLKALLEARRHAEGESEGAPAAGSPVLDGGAMLDTVTGQLRRISEGFVESAQIVARAPDLLPWAQQQADDPVKRARWIDAVVKIASVLAVAVLAQALAGWLLRRPLAAIEARASDNWGVRLLILLTRMLLELVPVAAFALAAEFALAILDTRDVIVSATRALVMANVLVRGVMVVTRTILAPRVSRLRLLPLDDESANYAYIWVRRIATTALYTAFAIRAAAILGLPPAGRVVLNQFLALVLVGMAVALILQMRARVRDWIAGANDGTASGLRARLADIWHVVAILYVVALFCIWLLDIAGGFELVARATGVTLLAGIAAVLLDFGVNRALDHLFALRDETRALYPGLEVRAARYLPIVHGIVRAAIWFVALIVAVEAWGVDAVALLTSNAGRAVIGALAQIIVISVLAVAALELASAAIERYMRRSQDRGSSTARMLTLLPLLRNVLRVTIAIFATLIVLSEIGIDIGPLLAGAGVAGLAIGFGAQKLVQDVINGMFLIIEDTVSVGDVVGVAGHTGLCEAITIRTITLRDLSGTVHTVPFSDVTTVENLTKDFSYALLEVGVAYREDTDAVIELLQRIDEEMRGEEAYGPFMTEPLEVLGVDAFADSAVVIKVRIKTVPIKQWMIKREFNRRMKKLFDANNIEIPFPHTTLYFGVDKQGAAPPARLALDERLAALADNVPDNAVDDGDDDERPNSQPGADLPQ